MNASESEAFEKYRKVEERTEKIKLKLEKARSQMDTICSLYTYILTCRSPTNNYAIFFMERYLQLKIKAVKAGKPIDLKTIEDFINCCKHHMVKV